MAHFAKIDENNAVIKVVAVHNNVITDENGDEQESLGIEFLKNLYNEPNANWLQTSYNTRSGKYYNADGTEGDQSKAFRKNFAGIGYTYDAGRDAFIGPRPTNSFVLDEATCTWVAPVAYPTITEKDGLMYIIEWDDSNDRWVGTVGGGNPQRWNPETSEWIEI